MKCSRFARARLRQRHSLMTRRAVWRRSERRRQKRRQKKAQRKQSAGRRSRQPPLHGLQLLNDVDGRVKRTGGVEQRSQSLPTRRPCRRQRASARQRVRHYRALPCQGSDRIRVGSRQAGTAMRERAAFPSLRRQACLPSILGLEISPMPSVFFGGSGTCGCRRSRQPTSDKLLPAISGLLTLRLPLGLQARVASAPVLWPGRAFLLLHFV
jgi:hypothetical protein